MILAEGLNLGQVLEGSAWAIVAGVLWYLLTKTIPNQLKKIESLETKIEGLEKSFRSELNTFKIMMIHHDLTSRGENRGGSDDHEELKRLAGELEDEP